MSRILSTELKDTLWCCEHPSNMQKEAEAMLLRWDPFREPDRLTEPAYRGLPQTAVLPMDAYRQGESFVIHFDLPGADPETIDLTIEKNVLTVKAQRTWERTEGDEVVVAERRHGSFQRQLFLGETLDTDHVDARYDNGVLTVIIPLAERAKARKVDISVGHNEPKAVEAAATAA